MAFKEHQAAVTGVSALPANPTSSPASQDERNRLTTDLKTTSGSDYSFAEEKWIERAIHLVRAEVRWRVLLQSGVVRVLPFQRWRILLTMGPEHWLRAAFLGTTAVVGSVCVHWRHH